MVEAGKYYWQGVYFDSPPHQLEVDLGRGVLYMHSYLTGATALRVCRIPGRVLWQFLAGVGIFAPGVPVIDLQTTTPDALGESTGLKGIVKREVALFDLPEYTNGGGRFVITGWESLEDIYRGEVSREFFVFTSVPLHIVKQLWFGEFADITIGFTGR